MEYLKDTENFGSSFKKGDNLEEFFSKLISFVERRLFNRLSKRVNFLLTRINDQKLEIVADGNSDKNENGNFRIIVSGGNVLIQAMASGTWTETGWIPRTVSADPTAIATNGSLGEIVFYNDKWYGKTVADGTDTNWSALN